MAQKNAANPTRGNAYDRKLTRYTDKPSAAERNSHRVCAAWRMMPARIVVSIGGPTQFAMLAHFLRYSAELQLRQKTYVILFLSEPS